MSEYEEVFIATAEKPSQFSRLLVGRLGFEYIPGHDPQHSEVLGLRRRAITTDGIVDLSIYPNMFVDPDSDEAHAFDAYPLQIDLWLPRPRPGTEAQEAEARAWFDGLAEARSDLPMLLTHEITLLYAAYLPGRSVHDFPAGTTAEAKDIGAWLPWVVKTATMPA
jgi:hypothetical protein